MPVGKIQIMIGPLLGHKKDQTKFCLQAGSAQPDGISGWKKVVHELLIQSDVSHLGNSLEIYFDATNGCNTDGKGTIRLMTRLNESYGLRGSFYTTFKMTPKTPDVPWNRSTVMKHAQHNEYTIVEDQMFYRI